MVGWRRMPVWWKGELWNEMKNQQILCRQTFFLQKFARRRLILADTHILHICQFLKRQYLFPPKMYSFSTNCEMFPFIEVQNIPSKIDFLHSIWISFFLHFFISSDKLEVEARHAEWTLSQLWTNFQGVRVSGVSFIGARTLLVGWWSISGAIQSTLPHALHVLNAPFSQICKLRSEV